MAGYFDKNKDYSAAIEAAKKSGASQSEINRLQQERQNKIDAVYGGIRLCLDGCAGFSVKSFDHCRGGRVFEINEDGSHSTHSIFVQDLIDISK